MANPVDANADRLESNTGMTNSETMSDLDNSPRDTQDTNEPAISNQTKVGLVAFGSIFLAEMGDKTQLATVLLSAQSHHPVITFAGAASALVLTSLIGVWAGRWVADRVSPRTIKLAAGIGFIGIGGWVLWDVLQVAS
ncbi:MAG: TMEM165/GDT1 family protein [Cyanobacteria bacterium P01_A01_bin.3]